MIIAGAGGAAHLPGMVAAQTLLPVLGVPVQSQALNGLDSLLSIVQMPVGRAGRDAGHRQGRRHQRRAARRPHSWPAPGRSCARSFAAFVEEQTRRVLDETLPG